MMRRWLAAALLLGLVSSALPARAASSHSLAINPVFQEAEISADHPIRDVTVELSNFTATDQRFGLSTVDFSASGEDGGVAFLGQSAAELNSPRRLAEWMTLGSNTVTVPAGGSVKVQVTITNRAGMAPGGHYGAVLATAIDNGAAGDGKIGLKQALSSLVLVTKDGGGQGDLKLVSQTANRGWSLPANLEHRFENSGNIHVTPRGVTTITDPAGRMVRRGALNASSGIILPDSFRRYATPLVSTAAAWLPGRYTVTTTYRYDGSSATRVLVTHIWYIGQVGLWLSLLVALAASAFGAWWLVQWSRRRPRRSRRRK